MSEAPKKIWILPNGRPTDMPIPSHGPCYIRADLVDGLVEALESMYEIAKDVEDSGPLHEGWQSNELVEELRKAQTALAALREEA